eukprot:SAG22_NODE_3340_length_1769_cov_1.898802_1_plen_74_part_10
MYGRPDNMDDYFMSHRLERMDREIAASTERQVGAESEQLEQSILTAASPSTPAPGPAREQRAPGTAAGAAAGCR